MKRCIHAGVSHATQGRAPVGEDSWDLACSSCYYPERFRRSLFQGQNNLSLLHALLPLKAYHDGSRFQLRLFDAVPCALIVIAVLSWYSVVSLLDRRVRFDYPKRASGDPLLKRNALLAVRSTICCKVFVLSSFESGSSVRVPDWESHRKPPFGHHTVY
jgi:hypothetical protein